MGLTAKKVYAILNGKIKKISGDISGMGTPLFYAGSVETADLLPLSPNAGAVYNIEKKSIYGEAGTNVAWNGALWDALGPTFDLSLLLTKEDAKNIYLFKNQGLENAGKMLVVGEDGNVILKDAKDVDVEIDATLTHSGKAADAKVVGDRIKSIEDYINTVAVPMTWENIQNMIAKGYHKKVFKIGDKLTNTWLDPNASMIEDYINTVAVPMTWENIQNMIAKGYHKKVFKIGDKLTNTWLDPNASMKEYENPLRINHFQDGLELENGQLINGMWLQTQYAQLKGVQFSHQRALLRCPDGLVPGTYYFTFESNWGNNVKAGDIVCFTTTQQGVQFSHQRALLRCPDGLVPGTYYFTFESNWGNNVKAGDIVCFTTTQQIPVGGRVSGCHGAPDQTKDKWKIYTHSADGKNIIETITPTFVASGVDLGIQKLNSRNGNLNSTQEMAYGWNRWKTSAIRQYLNSDKLKGEWWVAQDEWDIAPDQLSQIDGYLKGIDPELLAVIQPVKVTTYANTVNDGGAADVTYDKVILPSLEQMYIAPQISGEGEAHQYYKELNGTDAPYKQYGTFPELTTYAIENYSSAQGVRLRSAHRGYAYNAWYVYASGVVNANYASGAYRFSPLVFIGTSPISAPTDAELGV